MIVIELSGAASIITANVFSPAAHLLYLLIAIAALTAALYWFRRWQNLPKKDRSRAGKTYLLWGLAAVLILLVLTGRAHWLMGVLAALLAVLGRIVQIAQYIPFIQKIIGEAKAAEHGSAQQPGNQAMTRAQAAEILGIAEDASAEEVRMAHKKLMQKIHPDRGGTDALARQINQAKDRLLE